jgi:hypothetical protein
VPVTLTIDADAVHVYVAASKWGSAIASAESSLVRWSAQPIFIQAEATEVAVWRFGLSAHQVKGLHSFGIGDLQCDATAVRGKKPAATASVSATVSGQFSSTQTLTWNKNKSNSSLNFYEVITFHLLVCEIVKEEGVDDDKGRGGGVGGSFCF